MIAINSDVEFTSWDTQIALLRLFQKNNIEPSFSYWCFSNNQKTWSLFDYNLNRNSYIEKAYELIRLGIFDTFHSYGGYHESGGKLITREKMKNVLHILKDNGVKTRVFSNHGGVNDNQNIGGYWASYQLGDLIGSQYYNLDLLKDFGIDFFWTDLDYDNDDSVKFINNTKNSLIKTQLCRDNNNIIRFSRFRGNFGTKKAPTINNFKEQISYILNNQQTGYTIIYQHLGCNRVNNKTIKPVTNLSIFELDQTLNFIRELEEKKDIIITSTQRLIIYALVMYTKPWNFINHKDYIEIELLGFTYYNKNRIKLTKDDFVDASLKLKKSSKVEISFKKKHIKSEIINFKKKKYLFIPWKRKNIVIFQYKKMFYENKL